MSNFKNMKIEINEQQPLDEVVKELDRLGYVIEHKTNKNVKCVCSYDDGTMHLYMKGHESKFGNLTTLTELKTMEVFDG